MGQIINLKDHVSFSGYASVFDVVDRGQDVIEKGAFAASLKDRSARGIKLLWQHDPKEPIGMIDEIYEDVHGLFIKGRLFLDIARAKEAAKLMREEALDGLSIGFHTLTSVLRDDGVRLLKNVDLWEVSLVTFPMNEMARVTDFKEFFPCKSQQTAAVVTTTKEEENAALLAGIRHLTNLIRLER